MNSIGQFFLALFVGWCFYMLAVVMMELGSLAVQPILGAFVTFFALMPVFLVGLPLRWVASLNGWWRANWRISFVLGAVAVALMLVSWLPQLRVQYTDPNLDGRTIDSPHPWLGLSGWLLVMFAAAHYFPPRSEPAKS